MKPTAQSAEYYLGLNYPMEVRKLAASEGGGYIATIPLLGRKTFVADGKTAEEALAALLDLKEQLIPMLVEDGVVLPEPDQDRGSL